MSHRRLPAPRPARAAAVCIALLAAAVLSVPLPDPLFPSSYGTVVSASRGEVLHTYLAPDEQRRFRLEAASVPPKLSPPGPPTASWWSGMPGNATENSPRSPGVPASSSMVSCATPCSSDRCWGRAGRPLAGRARRAEEHGVPAEVRAAFMT